MLKLQQFVGINFSKVSLGMIIVLKVVIILRKITLLLYKSIYLIVCSLNSFLNNSLILK